MVPAPRTVRPSREAPPRTSSRGFPERLLQPGGDAVSRVELVAALLAARPSRARSLPLGAARDLLDEAGGWIGRIPRLLRTRASGLPPDPDARIRVLAGVELGLRMELEAMPEPQRIRGPADVHHLMAPRLRHLDHEEFHVVVLNTRHAVLGVRIVSRGLLDASLVHPREVFRPALELGAAAVILVHNHPSGDPSPSPEDRAVTRRMGEAGEILGIRVLDHVVVGAGRWESAGH
ncbi:MAG: DNA repair protein RadC [Gemmatimonadales bacterium]|nr:MAG: DNA repair protein RadC [Gemmatimonadales bacterium]